MEQPGQGQDPQATQPPAAAPDSTQAVPATTATPSPAPSSPPAGNGPWANDLAQTFADPNVRASVDEFLRTKVQPYNTRLEQQAAQAQQAMNLWSQLEQNPVDTYVQMTNEMFGEQAAQELLNTLQTQLSQQQAQPESQWQQPPQPQQGLDPRIEAALQFVEQQQTQQHYASELERISQAHPDLAPAIEKGLLHTFVAAAGGDFDQAVNDYRWATEQFGQLQQQAPPPPPPPNVMGSDTGGAPAATPLQPQKETLDEAITGFLRDSRTNAAPPVGTL